MVERQPSKLRVAGSNPVSRSMDLKLRVKISEFQLNVKGLSLSRNYELITPK